MPPTEAKGRIHTSTLNVTLLEEREIAKVEIDWSKVVTTYYKDSGAGGQHRNRTFSGVRLQYQGITVECCEGRDQHKNREIAQERLQERLQGVLDGKAKEEHQKDLSAQNRNRGCRGGFMRNYNFPRGEVVQGGKRTTLKKFMRGDFGDFGKED